MKRIMKQMKDLQEFLETFDFYVGVEEDTSFDIFGRADSKVVVLPIQ